MIGHIISGWWNVIFRKDKVEVIAKKRIAICARCLDIPVSLVEEYKCTECNCPLIAKVRSPDECPNKLW